MRGAVRIGLLTLVLGAAGAGPGVAQPIGVIQSDIVVMDTERLLEETRLGRRLIADVQAERDDLIARNERLRLELEAEEQELTDLRADLSPEAFRELADAFDARVQQIREDSARRARDLERQRDLIPTQFMQIVQPVLQDLLQDANASVMMDRRAVLLAIGAIDVTDLAIGRIDAAVDDGRQDAEPGAEDTR